MDIKAATLMFLNDRRHSGCCAGTVNAYAKQLRWFNAYLDRRGVSDISALTVDDFGAYLVDLQLPERKLSSVTTHKRMLTLRGYCLWLYRAELIPRNIAGDIPLPPEGKLLPKSLSPSQTRQLLAAAMCERDRAIISLMLETGVRESECCALDVDDIDLEGGTMLIRVGKGDKQRVVIFEAETRRLLKDWIAVRETKEPALFVSLHANGEAQPGARLSSNGLYGAIKRIAEKSGLGKAVSPHRLRHTCAVTLLDNGAQLDLVQEVLGHETISMTLKYTHVSRERLRKAYKSVSPMNSLKQKSLTRSGG